LFTGVYLLAYIWIVLIDGYVYGLILIQFLLKNNFLLIKGE